MARPKFEPTAEERANVETLSALGLSHDQIVLVVRRPAGKEGRLKPISKPTLRKAFHDELATGTVKLIGNVGNALALTAADRKHPQHVAAARFLMKVRAGWSERSELELTGGLDLNLDLSGASDEELAVLAKFLKKKVGGSGYQAANAA